MTLDMCHGFYFKIYKLYGRLGMIIAMAGTIGAGKTSLTDALSKLIDSKNYYESVDDNEILPMFYKDRERYALMLQIYFLNNRFSTIKSAIKDRENGMDVILDRSIYEDSLLFHLNIDQINEDKPKEERRDMEKQGEIYDGLITNMMEDLPLASSTKAPDLVIYLKSDLTTALDHVKIRGREFEQVENDPTLLPYYTELVKRYDTWYQNYDQSAKMTINVHHYDFVNNKDDYREVMTSILTEMIKVSDNDSDIDRYAEIINSL